jgi:hypothetical protein
MLEDDEVGKSRNWTDHGNLDLHEWAFDRFATLFDYKAETEGIDVKSVSEFPEFILIFAITNIELSCKLLIFKNRFTQYDNNVCRMIQNLFVFSRIIEHNTYGNPEGRVTGYCGRVHGSPSKR